MARPVLMYHSVAPGPGPADRDYNISPPRFWHSIALLRRLGMTVSVELQAPPSPRTAVITFDDGYEDLYTEVFPRFQALGLKAVVFAVAGKLGGAMDWNPAIRKTLMTAAQMREMHAYGFHFGSHTLSHCDLASAAPDVMRDEITGSKARLEDILGAPVTLFSYPWGRVNARVRGAVAEAGFTVACTTEPRLNCGGDDPLLIPRLTVSEMDTSLGMTSKLLTGHDLTGMTPVRAWRWLRRRVSRTHSQPGSFHANRPRLQRTTPLMTKDLPDPKAAKAKSLAALIADRKARIGVIGMGYVGQPLAIATNKQGFDVTASISTRPRWKSSTRAKAFLGPCRPRRSRQCATLAASAPPPTWPNWPGWT